MGEKGREANLGQAAAVESNPAQPTVAGSTEQSGQPTGSHGDLSEYKALTVGRPWVLGVENQVVGERGAEVGTLTTGETASTLDPFQRGGSGE